MGKKSQFKICDALYTQYCVDNDEENNVGPEVLKKLPALVEVNKGWKLDKTEYIYESVAMVSSYGVVCKLINKYAPDLIKSNKRLRSKEMKVYASDIPELTDLNTVMLDYGTYYINFGKDEESKDYGVLIVSNPSKPDEDGYVSDSCIHFVFYIIGKHWQKYRQEYIDLYSFYKNADEESSKRETRIKYASGVKPNIKAVFKSFDNLIMSDKQNYINYIDNWVENIPKYYSYGMTPKLSILLSGSPGTGKSSFCKAVAKYLGIDTIVVYDPSCFDIKDNSKSRGSQYGSFVCALDDIDCFCKSRDDDDSRENGKILSSLLEFLDNPDTFYFKAKDNKYYPVSIVIATTNYYDKLDPAVKRYGRFDLQIEMKDFDYNSAKEMANVYNVKLDDILDKNIDKKIFTISPAKLQALCMANLDKAFKTI